MKATPTIHFFGHCEEAITLYQKAFQARIGCLLHYADADARDWDVPMDEEQRRRVYHAEFYIGETRVMCSDELEGTAGTNPLSFMNVTFDCAEDVRRAYDIFAADGCKTIYAPHSTTYSSCMCSIVDRFGARWGLMTEQTER